MRAMRAADRAILDKAISGAATSTPEFCEALIVAFAALVRTHRAVNKGEPGAALAMVKAVQDQQLLVHVAEAKGLFSEFDA